MIEQSAESLVFLSWMDGNTSDVDLQVKNWPSYQINQLRRELDSLNTYLWSVVVQRDDTGVMP